MYPVNKTVHKIVVSKIVLKYLNAFISFANQWCCLQSSPAWY